MQLWYGDPVHLLAAFQHDQCSNISLTPGCVQQLCWTEHYGRARHCPVEDRSDIFQYVLPIRSGHLKLSVFVMQNPPANCWATQGR